MVEDNNPAAGSTMACAKMEIDFPFVKVHIKSYNTVTFS